MLNTPDDKSAQDLLEAHLRALREQIAARKKQREMEAELLVLARQEFDRRCERDGKCHHELQVSQDPPVLVRCDLKVRPVPLDSALYAMLPDWLIAAGASTEQIGIRDACTSGPGAQELVSAIDPEAAARFFDLHHDYLLPADILEHPDVRDPAVQQHVAWLVAQGLLKVRSELLSIELRPEYTTDPGAYQLRSSLPADVYARCFEQRQVWLPPTDIANYRYSRDAREWSGAEMLVGSEVIAFAYSLHVGSM